MVSICRVVGLAGGSGVDRSDLRCDRGEDDDDRLSDENVTKRTDAGEAIPDGTSNQTLNEGLTIHPSTHPPIHPVKDLNLTWAGP